MDVSVSTGWGEKCEKGIWIRGNWRQGLLLGHHDFLLVANTAY